MNLPTLFVSHGSPMCALRTSAMAHPWAALAAALPRPKAVLVLSAHWETGLPMVGTAARPDTLYDFGGFPEVLRRIRYGAPGAPELAQQALTLLGQAGLPASAVGCRGLDHGAWVPLLHMFPEAQIGAFQVSIQTSLGPGHHLRLGRALAPLRAQGVLIVGSGSLTHNLQDWMRGAQHGGLEPALRPALPYVAEFSDAVEAALRHGDTDTLSDFRSKVPHAARAHPSDEHFVPLLAAFAAAGTNPTVERINPGADGGVLAMDAFVFHASARAKA